MHDTEQAGTVLLHRWLRVQMHVRCGLSPHAPSCIQVYLHRGLRLVRRGLQPAVAAHLRMLRTLLLTAEDDALPRAWRSMCLAHVDLPLGHLALSLGVHDPVAMQALEAAVQRARDRLPRSRATPRPAPRPAERPGTP